MESNRPPLKCQQDNPRVVRERTRLATAVASLACRRGARCLLVSDLARGEVKPEAPYDLILAPALADRIAPDNLARALIIAGSLLAPRGKLTMSAFLPDGPERGRRLGCQGRGPFRHSEEAILAAAADAGFEARIFHEASGSLVWAELRLIGGGKS